MTVLRLSWDLGSEAEAVDYDQYSGGRAAVICLEQTGGVERMIAELPLSLLSSINVVM